VAGRTTRSSSASGERFDTLTSHWSVPNACTRNFGGDPAAEAYPAGNIPYHKGFEEGWIVVADELDYTNPRVSTTMDDARRWIANDTGRTEDVVEKADTALVGLAVQPLDAERVDEVVLLTTDKPAGKAAETLLPEYGFVGQIEFRYVSEASLETVTADEFR